MKITISGTPGSGKSTVAKEIAKKLKLNHFSAGDFYRKMAKEKGVSVLELARMAEKDPEIDRKLDSWVEAVGEADDNFVMDARVAFNFIPESIKVFLDASDAEAAKRIYKQMRSDERENTTQGATFENIKARKDSERKRYMQYYDVDYLDPDNYDLVVDTSGVPVAEVVDRIIKFIMEREK